MRGIVDPNEASYVEEFYTAHNRKDENTLYKLIGKHAAFMIDMAIHDRAEKKRDLMKSWAKIDRLNTRWINMMCPVSEHSSDFQTITKRLIRGYSDLLGDYVVDGWVNETHEKDLIDALVKYYDTLSNYKTEKIKSAVNRYTHTVKKMTEALDRHGSKSDAFFSKARECMAAGQFLGSQLDCTIFC